jgi:hypothetical protein
VGAVFGITLIGAGLSLSFRHRRWHGWPGRSNSVTVDFAALFDISKTAYFTIGYLRSCRLRKGRRWAALPDRRSNV